jgi:hypothetical protein
MKIRWINDRVRPLPHAPRWIVVMARYPALILLATGVPAGLGVMSWRRLTELESGQRRSVYLGFLRPLYKWFGVWGVVGFFLFLTACGLYLFWVFALSRPREPAPPGPGH